MTKFNRSSATNQWLCIFKEELARQLTLCTWLKQADARLENCEASWVEQMPEVIRDFADKNIGTAII